MTTPEFSRPVRADQVRRMTGEVYVAADAAERAALAKRFGLAALDRLEADYVLTEEDGAILARGRLRASASASNDENRSPSRPARTGRRDG